jgi:hypothetical protein
MATNLASLGHCDSVKPQMPHFIVGKLVGIVFGAAPNDIPWLIRLEVADRCGSGILFGCDDGAAYQHNGWHRPRSCDDAGAYLSVPYSADYVFLGKGA